MLFKSKSQYQNDMATSLITDFYLVISKIVSRWENQNTNRDLSL
jgi:hypothetical protein